MGDQLSKKITKAKEVIEKALSRWGKRVAIAWTGGKDSTVVLHLIKSVRGKIDLPVLNLDTGIDHEKTYAFIERISKNWGFSLWRVGDPQNLALYQKAKSEIEKSQIAAQMKLNALKRAFELYRFPALFVGIRADEHPARSKEKYFSKRETHTRIHPILHFSEKDVWEYIRVNKVPYNPLYDLGYRSLDARDLTRPVPPSASERAGRDKYKETVMDRLRALGYF